MKYANILLAVWCAVLTLIMFAWPPAAPTRRATTRFEELTVERLNIVEADGTTRMALTNRARMPEPIVDGKAGKRAIQTAGIILYDEEGNETGGLVPGSRRPDGSFGTGFILDHRRTEAAGFAHVRRPGRASEAFLFINDPVLESGEETFDNTNRVRIGTEDRTSSIELKDTSGRPRIRLSVDANDQPSIAILGADGKVTAHFPGATN